MYRYKKVITESFEIQITKMEAVMNWNMSTKSQIWNLFSCMIKSSVIQKLLNGDRKPRWPPVQRVIFFSCVELFLYLSREAMAGIVCLGVLSRAMWRACFLLGKLPRWRWLIFRPVIGPKMFRWFFWYWFWLAFSVRSAFLDLLLFQTPAKRHNNGFGRRWQWLGGPLPGH